MGSRMRGAVRRFISNVHLRLVEFVVAAFPNPPFWSRLKFRALRSLGAQLEWPVHIDRGVWIASPQNLRAGPGLVLARGTVMTCAGGIEIGSGCLFGYYSFVCSANHTVPTFIDEPIYSIGHDLAPVRIGDNCWVGAHACVLPGVILGDGCVVGAGTVVPNSAPEGALLVGASARVVRKRGRVPSSD